MIAVIFEVWPADGRKQTYLDIAASLKPELERIDGFIRSSASRAWSTTRSCSRFPSGATRRR